MGKKSKNRKKAGPPIGANKSLPSPASAIIEALARRKTDAADEKDVLSRDEVANLREEVADKREKTADKREKTADLRKETADLREATADLREATADLREEAGDLRDETGDKRERSVDKRETEVLADEEAVLRREEKTSLREERADKREKVLRTQKKALKAESALSVQLRETNEQLIIELIHAQAMTEASEQTTAQMSHMAQHDFLTGLPNRSLMTDRLAQSIALAQRHEKKVALIYLDLDHFKHINDSLGHAVGDKLLQSVAKRLQTCVRISDTVSRQGGDEFVVLLPEVGEVQDAVVAAEKLIEAMSRPHLVSGHRLRITISIGISIYPEDAKDIETLLSNADTAMYQAKKTGRNNYQMFVPEMNVRAAGRLGVEREIQRALEQHKFVLHYQPRMNLETGAMTGVEAFVRMWDSDDQLVYPAHFLGIAEECGLILPIGGWALHEACRQARAWLQSGFDIGQIAINVSSREFHGKDFLAGVVSALNDTGLDSRQLELEMMETGLMQDPAMTTAVLHALKKLGVRIAVDDFGTGYSSLSCLLRYPIDTLKIDHSFVQNLDGETGNSSEAIVSAVIAMGTSLKKRVVAEGIETQQQLAFLKSHRCAEGQGFYFTRPVPADAFASLLQNRSESASHC